MKRKVVCFGLDDTLFYEIDFAKSAFAEISRFLEANHGIPKQDAFIVMFDAFKAKEDAIDAIFLKYCFSIMKMQGRKSLAHLSPFK